MAKQNKKLVEQSEALTDFFESLMNDVNAYQEQEETQACQHANNSNLKEDASNVTTKDELPQDTSIHIDHSDKTQVQQLQDTVPEQQTEIVEPDSKLFEALPSVMPEPVVVEENKAEINITEKEIIAVKDENEVENNSANEALPEWCQHDFQAMLFKVAGLTLAVPLVDLNGVVECDLDDVSAMPGHADFYFGLMQYLDKNVPLVDTARFVLPADKLSTLLGDDPGTRITRAVLIQDCQYGLACDEVNEVVTLSPEDVRWRTQRTQRRWLAGTVVEHMCALIDATAFAELLAEQTPIQAFRE